MRFTRCAAAWLVVNSFSVAAFAQPELFIDNYHRVDEHVLRGARPGSDGVRALAAIGVKTILDLRPGNEREAKEKTEAEALGIKYVSLPMNGFRAPTNAEIDKALDVLNDPAAWPVFVHCKYGQDRTGTVIACYRMRHDGWDNQKALAEAKRTGMHGFEFGMKSYILAFDGRPDKTTSTR